MKKRVKAAVLAAIVLCAAAFALIYTRPRTLAQRYPLVDLADCTSIEGDYSVWQGDEAHFAIEPGDPDFDAMLELLRSAAFRTQQGQNLRKHYWGVIRACVYIIEHLLLTSECG